MEMKHIVGIFGVPRSGTSWVGQIFNSSSNTKFAYQPMFAERYQGRIEPRSDAEEMRVLFEDIYLSGEDFLSQNDGKDKATAITFPKRKEQPEWFVFKEVMYLYMIPHLLQNLQEMKAVLMIRNPYAVLQSWYNAPREFYPEWDIRTEWLFAQKKNYFLPERYYGYHRWKEYIALVDFLEKEFVGRVYVLKYENLVCEPEKAIEPLFDFLDIEIEKQTRDFIVYSQSKTETNPYSVFRNPRQPLEKKLLPNQIVSEINEELKKFTLVQKWYDTDTLYKGYAV